MKIQKRTIKIVSASAMCVFSLFATVVATLAWFVTRSNVNVDNNNRFNVRKTGSAVSSINIYDYLGTTTDGTTFGFDPSSKQTVEISEESSGSFVMGTYSLNEPHHPVLFIFDVNGGNEHVFLNTACTYLGLNAPSYSATVATYSALATYANGTKVKVTADENHYGTSTIYEYIIPANGSPYFEMVWIDLKASNNPLSSVIESHFLLFTDDPTDNAGTYRTSSGNLKLGNTTTNYNSFIPISKSSLIDNPNDSGYNRSSFVSFSSGGNPTFEKSATLFNGDTTGKTHLGIILDYYSDAVTYIYSLFLGSPLFDNNLAFTCDWDMEL